MQAITLKGVMFVLLLGGCVGVLFLPLHRCIQIFFLYIGVEGFAKLITNYNPIIHIGADIFIIVLWVKVGIERIINRDIKQIQMPPVTTLIFIHFGWFLVTIANPYSLSLVASLAGMKIYVTIISLYFFGYMLSDDAEKIRGFLVPWVVICFLQVATSLYQAKVGPTSVTSISDAYITVLEKYRGYAFRPPGLASQPGGPAIFVYLLVPTIVYFIFHVRSLLLSLLLILSLPACLATMLVCQIRSALLKAILGASGYLTASIFRTQQISAKARILILTGIGIGGILIASFTPYILDTISEKGSTNEMAVKRTLTLFNLESIQRARSGALDRFLRYASKAPLGAGLSRSGSAAGKFSDLIKKDKSFSEEFFADNLWVELVVDLGIPGAFIYTLILISICYYAVKGFRTQDPDLRPLHNTLFFTLFAILVGAYGAEPILYNPEGAFFWFFSGTLVRIYFMSKPTALPTR
ncbi:MAG: hypothetical protein HYX41_03285 [Bdellovibrio sp.]|nr:hypothetical protein [Bdellovibrio sp.]